MRLKSVVLIIAIIFIFFGLLQIKTIVFAEQSGSSPESGITSRIKTAYDWLVAKGANYGATDASDWTNNWGSMWNRIMESATWEPDGTATEADVASTKTFYAGNGDRTIKIGTASPPIDWTTQSLQDYDDYRSPDNTGDPEDYQGEESTWSETATGVFYDSRTGLWWAQLPSHTNQFTYASCDFFTTSPRGAYAGGDADCGVAINTCGALSKEDVTGDGAKTDWYLPSQKEILQAYIDGIENQPSGYDLSYYYWSSTEYSPNTSYGWRVDASSGDPEASLKTAMSLHFCVRRN